MFSQGSRRAVILALSLLSLTLASTGANALRADRSQDAAESGADRQAAKSAKARSLDFSQVGRSTFSSAGPGAARPRFAAPATASPQLGAKTGTSAYGALPPARLARNAGEPATTGSLYQGLTQSDSPYGWLVTVNVKGAWSPKYTGAASYGFIGYPTLSFRRPGMPEKWSSPDDGISLNLYETERFAIGPVVRYRGGRYSNDAPELAGMRKPRWTLEGGVFADLWMVQDKLRLRGEVRRGMRERDGVNGQLGADYVHRFGQFTFAMGPRMKFGNDHFMRNQFGVSEEDSRANPRYAAYAPKYDIYAVGVYGSATYKQNKNWSYTVHGGFDRLRGEAARSPIVSSASGSRDQWTLGAIVSYTFGVGVGR